MKNFSQTFLVNSISIVLFGGGLTQTIWANDEINALPTIKVAAEKEQETNICQWCFAKKYRFRAIGK
jgi:iron complex outermembrane receptor protein